MPYQRTGFGRSAAGQNPNGTCPRRSATSAPVSRDSTAAHIRFQRYGLDVTELGRVFEEDPVVEAAALGALAARFRHDVLPAHVMGRSESLASFAFPAFARTGQAG